MSGRRRPGYRRGRPRMEPEPAVLIVTEGEKTERLYFEGLRDGLRLAATRVEVLKADGTDPTSIINYAIARRMARKLEAKRGESVEYEEVWAVFDSEHKLDTPELENAILIAKREGIRVAMSSPCFEYWIILHFEYTTQYMCSYREAVTRLKTHIPGYDKSNPPVADLLLRLPVAIRNAGRCRVDQDKTGTKLPRTDVDRLAVKLNCAAREHNRIM